MADKVKCPFCDEEVGDATDLKIHLDYLGCNAYEELEVDWTKYGAMDAIWGKR